MNFTVSVFMKLPSAATLCGAYAAGGAALVGELESCSRWKACSSSSIGHSCGSSGHSIMCPVR